MANIQNKKFVAQILINLVDVEFTIDDVMDIIKDPKRKITGISESSVGTILSELKKEPKSKPTIIKIGMRNGKDLLTINTNRRRFIWTGKLDINITRRGNIISSYEVMHTIVTTELKHPITRTGLKYLTLYYYELITGKPLDWNTANKKFLDLLKNGIIKEFIPNQQTTNNISNLEYEQLDLPFTSSFKIPSQELWQIRLNLLANLIADLKTDSKIDKVTDKELKLFYEMVKDYTDSKERIKYLEGQLLNEINKNQDLEKRIENLEIKNRFYTIISGNKLETIS